MPHLCGPPNEAFIFCLSHPTKLSASVWDGCVLEEGCCGLLVSLFPFCLIEILGARSEGCSHQVDGLARPTCSGLLLGLWDVVLSRLNFLTHTQACSTASLSGLFISLSPGSVTVYDLEL